MVKNLAEKVEEIKTDILNTGVEVSQMARERGHLSYGGRIFLGCFYAALYKLYKIAEAFEECDKMNA